MATTSALQRRTGREVADTGREPTRVPRYRPNVDILETADELRLLADMPGVKPESIDVRFENGTLTIYGVTGEDRDANRNYLMREYGVGDFYRAFEISQDIDAERISAESRNGVLTLHLPKVEAAKARKIEVRAQ
jgi:HSP20 family protein